MPNQKKFIVACILLVVLYSCKDANLNYVQSNLWQWDSGYKIGDGDFVEFDTSNYYRLSHDTYFQMREFQNALLYGLMKKITR